MDADEAGLTIKLTSEQVGQVLERAGLRAGMNGLLEGLEDAHALRRAVAPLIEDDSYSRSTLRALLVLAAFDLDGGERELSEVARELDLSASTTHRYVGTWLALGLLEQDAASRRYRRSVSAPAPV